MGKNRMNRFNQSASNLKEKGKRPIPDILINMLINIGLGIVFIRLWKFSDDPDNCWAGADNKEVALLEKSVLFPDAKTNVGKQFHTWFMFGMIIQIVGLVLGIIGLLQHVGDMSALNCIAKCIAAPMGCGGCAWLICGMVLRWRMVGRICSGSFASEEY